LQVVVAGSLDVQRAPPLARFDRWGEPRRQRLLGRPMRLGEEFVGDWDMVTRSALACPYHPTEAACTALGTPKRAVARGPRGL
jgi:hypothetical protein